MNIDLESLRRLAFDAQPVLLDSAVKSVVLLAVAGAVVLAMRQASAAARQVVWLLALTSLIALPIASAALPSWDVLPDWARFELPAEPAAADSADSPSAELAPAEGISNSSAGPLGGEDRPDMHAAPSMAEAQAWSDEPLPPVVARETAPPAETDAPAAAASTPAPPAGPSWRRWVAPSAVAVCLAGALVCLLPLALGRISLWRLARRSRRIDGGSWGTLSKCAANAIGLRRPITLLQSSAEPMPMVWGVLRPRLLLPAEAEEWSADRRWVVLLHELAHARRHDCLAKLIAHVACSLYWFNPLCWIAFKLMQREAEAACDDLVLNSIAAPAAARMGVSPTNSAAFQPVRPSDYAQHLLEIASGLKSGMLAAYSSIAMARPSKLEGRLLAILDARRNRRALTRIGLLIAATLIAAVAIPLAALKAASGVPGQADKRQLEAKVSRDEEQLGPKLKELRRSWTATQPRTAEELAAYDTVLTFDLDRGEICLRSAGEVVQKVSLPEGYSWTMYLVTPDGTKELGRSAGLKIRHLQEGRNVCREVFVLRGKLGEDTGLHVDIRPSLGWGCGTGLAKLPIEGYKFPTQRARPGDVDDSLLASPAETKPATESTTATNGYVEVQVAIRDTQYKRGDEINSGKFQVLHDFIWPVPADGKAGKLRVTAPDGTAMDVAWGSVTPLPKGGVKGFLFKDFVWSLPAPVVDPLNGGSQTFRPHTEVGRAFTPDFDPLVTSVGLGDAAHQSSTAPTPALVIRGRWVEAKEIPSTQPAGKPSAGIYLITARPKDVPFEKVPLADFTLADKPLIGESDIFEYDWELHTIRLKQQAVADRILKRKGVGDTDAFVVVAKGRRLYAGVMMSDISSYLPKAPVIHVGYEFEEHQPKKAVRIYPPPIAGTPDPRSAARLKQALQDLHLLSRPEAATSEPATQPASLSGAEPAAGELPRQAADLGRAAFAAMGNMDREAILNLAKGDMAWTSLENMLLGIAAKSLRLQGAYVDGNQALLVSKPARVNSRASEPVVVYLKASLTAKGWAITSWHAAERGDDVVLGMFIRERPQAKRVYEAPPLTAPPGGRMFPLYVVDESTGEALAQAGAITTVDGEEYTLISDANGVIRVPLRAKRPPNWPFYNPRLTMNVRLRGYLPVLLKMDQDVPDQFTLRLPPGKTIGGTIEDEEGRPVANASIGVWPAFEEPAPPVYALHYCRAFTDQKGRWLVDGVPDNTRDVFARIEHPDYVTDRNWHGTGPMEGLYDKTNVMVLKKSDITVSGVVVGSDGKPLAGATIWQGKDRFGAQYPTAKTDAAGRYVFPQTPAGRLVLFATAPGCSPQLMEVTAEKGMEPLNFNLSKGNTIRGIVLGSDGKPVEGVLVSVETWHGKQTLNWSQRTDAAGRFEWTEAPSGAVRMKFSGGKDEPGTVREMGPSEQSLTITLDGGEAPGPGGF